MMKKYRWKIYEAKMLNSTKSCYKEAKISDCRIGSKAAGKKSTNNEVFCCCLLSAFLFNWSGQMCIEQLNCENNFIRLTMTMGFSEMERTSRYTGGIQEKVY
jgi:hypothetical protein